MSDQLLLNDLTTLLNISENEMSMELDLSKHAYWDSLSVISYVNVSSLNH